MNAYSLKLVVSLVAALSLLSGNAALAGPVKVIVGTSHSVVIKSNGSAWGWGNNYYGQLGNASQYLVQVGPQFVQPPVIPPVQAAVSNAIAATANCYTTYVLKSDGTVWSYGENSRGGGFGNGQLTPPTTYTPTQALVESTKKALTNIIAIAAFSDHTIALKKGGTVWTWGHGRNGQLGDGTTMDHAAAVPVVVSRATSTSPAVYLTGVTSIAAGNLISYAIKGDGTVWAWGWNWQFGLGNSNTTWSSLEAVQVPGLANIIAIAPGLQHYVALSRDGTVWTWGTNTVGQLGDGSPSTTTRSTPVKLSSLSGITKISTHWDHTLAMKSDGTVWSWGPNEVGQLGNNTLTTSTIPVQVSASPGFTGVIDIAAGTDYSVAVTSTGLVFAWGNNDGGELGVSATTTPYSSKPIQVPGITP